MRNNPHRGKMQDKGFLVDVMLQKLGRWLRIIGVPTEMPESEDDTRILQQAKEHNLILLTRDQELAERAKKLKIKVFAIPKRETNTENQLKEVVKEFKLDLGKFEDKILCTKCGGNLELVDRSEVRGKIPDKVTENFSDFLRCRSCGQIYWEGRQWKKINERIKRMREQNKD